MTLNDEAAVKQALQIDSWRNLSKEKFLTFAANLDRVDKDVALGIIAQFPNFKALASDALSTIAAQHESLVASHDREAKHAYKGWKQYQRQLEKELERESLSSEDRYKFLDEMRSAAARMEQLGDKRDAFRLKLAGIGGTVVMVLAAAAIAALGGRGSIGRGGGA